MNPESKAVYLVRLFGVLNRFKPVEVEVEPSVEAGAGNFTDLSAQMTPQQLQAVEAINEMISATPAIPVSTSDMDLTMTTTTSANIESESTLAENQYGKGSIQFDRLENSFQAPQYNNLKARIRNLRQKVKLLKKSLRYQHAVIDEDDFEQTDKKTTKGLKSSFRSKRRHIVKDTKF